MVNCRIRIINSETLEIDEDGTELGLFIEDKFVVSYGDVQVTEFRRLQKDSQYLINAIESMMRCVYIEGGEGKLAELRKAFGMK